MQLAKVAKLKADEIVASESSDEEGWLVETSSTFAHFGRFFASTGEPILPTIMTYSCCRFLTLTFDDVKNLLKVA